MSKHTIKVSDEVYAGLQQMQRPRETLGEVVGRLQNVAILAAKLVPFLTTYRSELVLGVDPAPIPRYPDPNLSDTAVPGENAGEEG